jgi:hypothetical protein
MAEIKVMISRFYQGGAWRDEKTNVIFDPRKDAGKVFSFSPRMDLSTLAESVRKNHLVPFDQLTAVEFQRIVRDLPVVSPQVVEVRGKKLVLEVVFDRPVYPRPGKFIHVPTRQGEITIPVTDAFMEDYVTAIYQVDANGKVKIDAGAFVDDDGVLSEEYGVEKAPVVEPKAVVKEEVQEEAIEVEVQEEAPKKKQTAKKTRKKADE